MLAMTKATSQYVKPARFGPLRRTYIKEWREARVMKQKALAVAIDMSEGNLSRIEAGRNLSGVTQAQLEAIAEVLRCEPWDLLMHPPSDAQLDRDWMTEITGLSEAERKQALGHIRLIRGSRGQ